MLERIANDPTLAFVALGVLGLLAKELWASVRKAKEDKEDTVGKMLAAITGKLDAVLATQNAQGTATALLERDVATLKAETETQRDRHHDVKGQLGAIIGNAEVASHEAERAVKDVMRLEERLQRLEVQVATMAARDAK